MTQSLMLRIPHGTCQGKPLWPSFLRFEKPKLSVPNRIGVPGMRMETSSRAAHSTHRMRLCSSSGPLESKWTAAKGPIRISTAVLLTSTSLEPTLHGIEHCPTHRGRRIHSEKVGAGAVYRFATGSYPELLDIRVLRYIVPPGFRIPRRHNVTQTHGRTVRHARTSWRHGPEDGGYGARQRCCSYRRRSPGAGTLVVSRAR